MPNDEIISGVAARHRQILDLLSREGSVSVSRLAELLKVSEVTLRKDLNSLEQQRKLYRTHGSAILANPYIGDRHVNEKEKHNAPEKRAIAERAARRVAPDDSIIIASGTTMTFFAQALRDFPHHLIVITPALQVTTILSQNPGIEMIQLGGFIRPSSLSVVGKPAEDVLRDFHCSTLFIGVDGITPDFGLTTTNAMEASLNRTMIAASQKVVVLADSSKFGRLGFSKICDSDNVDEIITDSGIAPHLLAQLSARGIKTTVVGV
jgi:DeoR family transcriptional regulator of aga operon